VNHARTFLYFNHFIFVHVVEFEGKIMILGEIKKPLSGRGYRFINAS